MTKPYPAITPETEFFWTSGAEGRLCFQKCAACSTYVHPPQPRCPQCLAATLDIVAVSGRAKVATFTINLHQWHPEFPAPYAIAIVEIEEAPYVRLTTRIVNCNPADVTFDMPVQVVFEPQGPVHLPLFEPVRA
ncbi:MULTISPECIES: Zn-ribbon domain-containing OB-fold protein [unclassified Sphingobium]|uniref:Zn-ribbon domain-containing OB-fold protein n=1 Tax=unclassified Sphingobium TaxID=2611147 RepID=UPI0035A6B9F5